MSIGWDRHQGFVLKNEARTSNDSLFFDRIAFISYHLCLWYPRQTLDNDPSTMLSSQSTMLQNNARTLFTNLLELFIDYYENWVAIEKVCVCTTKKKKVG